MSSNDDEMDTGRDHPQRDELLCMAYVDDELAPDARKELERRMAGEPALAALNAGKHVLLEKPMALNVHDAQAIADAAGSAKGRLLYSHGGPGGGT